MISSLIVFVICLLLSAFFSASETALSSSNQMLLRRKAERGGSDAFDKAAYAAARDFGKCLPSLLLANNLANTALASISTQITYALLPFAFRRFTWLGTLISTLMVIIFCETVPKIAARSRSATISKAAGMSTIFLRYAFFPLSLLASAAMEAAEKGRFESDDENQGIDEDTLALAVEEVKRSGAIDGQEEELLVNAIDFDDTCVFEIATHRTDIDGIDINDDVKSVRDIAVNTKYSRLIVFDKSPDKVVGMAFTKVILKFFAANPNPSEDKLHAVIEKGMMSPLFVHMTMDLGDCLSLMKRTRKHLAVIGDEYGGTYGIVTMEDILENLSGDIWDESDDAERDVEKQGEAYRIKGDVELENMLDSMDVRNADEFTRDVESTSIGGLAFEILDRLPRKGDSFDFAGFRFVVSKMKGRRVIFLRARKIRPGGHA